MLKPDLVFLTPHNQAKIQARIAPHVKANLEAQQRREMEKGLAEKRRIDHALSSTKR